MNARAVLAAALVSGSVSAGMPEELRAQLVISEFLAHNTRTNRDADGDFSDWIEIENRTTAGVSLLGWRLTDDPNAVDKWRFPALAIRPGCSLLVFASGKDRVDPGTELHTNFELRAGGGFLALVRPDGTLLADELASRYPTQTADVSFGVGRTVLPSALVGSHALASVFAGGQIPDDSWLRREATPRGDWRATRPCVGWTPPAALNLPALLASWDFEPGRDRRSSDVLDLDGPKLVNDAPAARAGTPSLLFDGIDDVATASLDVPETDYSLTLWFRTESPHGGIFSVAADDDFRRTGSDRNVYLENGGLFARVWKEETIGGVQPNVADNRWHHVAHVVGKDVGGQHLYLDGELVASGTLARSDFDWQTRVILGYSKGPWGRFFKGSIHGASLWRGTMAASAIAALARGLQPVPDAFRAAGASELPSALVASRSAVCLRIPFDAQATGDYDSLELRVRHTSGFEAYLNGSEVASTLRQDARSPALLASETFDLPLSSTRLGPGAHVLALRSPPLGENSPVLLCAELLAVRRERDRFLIPSPGAPNSSGFAGRLSAPQAEPGRGLLQATIQVRLRADRPQSEIRYTLNGSWPSSSSPRLGDNETIPIDRTSVLRAQSFEDGFLPSAVVTQSYIFPHLVKQQPAAPKGLPSEWSGGFQADYAVDPTVAPTTGSPDAIEAALHDLPSLSVTCDPADLFDAQHGIYHNSTQRGRAWERRASVEFMDPRDHAFGFQVDAGIRIHGNSSRNHRFTPKHSLRLVFRSAYGPRQLKFPLFGRGSVERFDELVLRAGSTDSWPVRPGPVHLGVRRWHPERATYLRDQWMRDSQRALGHASCRGRFVHLYLNGLYWGVYNLAERPTAPFQASHFGGKREDYDVVKDYCELDSGSKDSWDELIAMTRELADGEELYARVQGRDLQGSTVSPPYLDIGNLIDYIILHIYAGAEDWPHHNWWAARRRGPESSGFRFFVWDQEISNDSLERTHNLTRRRIEAPFPTPSPSYVWGRLCESPSFRHRFRARLAETTSDGGSLAPTACARRWEEIAAEIGRAIVAESARWGDASRTPAYTREQDWLKELRWLKGEYWGENHRLALQRFKNAGFALDGTP